MDLREFLNRLSQRWQSMGQTQKITTLMFAVGAIVSIFYLCQFVQKASYTPLFTQLNPKEAGAIVEKLKAMKVPYQLSNQGQTVEVPRKEVYDVRIQLASSGALEGSASGFELFDQTKLGITDFEQQVDYQRALQEELRRTIVQLEGVEQARVHLVMPKDSVFIDEQPEPSASIALKLRPLTNLKLEQVKGIADLLVGSVERLKLENVHIIDMEGHVLSDGIQKNQEAILVSNTITKQKVKRAYEKELEGRIQQLLERVLGPSKAVAMVTADLDFANRETVVTAAYGEPVVLSEKIVKETGSAGEAGGVAGAPSNIEAPTYPSFSPGGEEGYSREEIIRNYQPGSKQETVIHLPGVLRRLSASVIVNGSLTPKEEKEIQGVVATAIGVDPSRGDQIMISGMNFDDSYYKKAEKEMQKAEASAQKAKTKNFYIYLGIALAALLLLTIGGFIISANLRRRAQQPIITEKVVVPIKEFEKFDEESSRINLKQESVKELARQKPEEVAQILKVWLSEDQG